MWTTEEDDYLRTHPHLTARDIGRHLDRHYSAVDKRRRLLGVSPGGIGERKNRKPNAIGTRTVVAKTCTACGLLLDAEWYLLRRDGRYASKCRVCKSAFDAGRDSRDRGWKDRVEAVAAETISRDRAEWTEADYAVIVDPSLTLLQMAAKLGRSYSAVANRRCLIGVGDPRALLGQPVENWVIRRPDTLTTAQVDIAP